MAFPGSSEIDLLLALHESVIGEARWTGFLSRLADMTGARFAALISRWPGSNQTDVAAAWPSGQAHAVDAHALSFVFTERMRPERIYAPHELADLTDTGEGLSMNAALARLSAISARAMRVTVPDTVSMILGIFGAREFDAADGAVLRRVYPFLQTAARTTARLSRERLRAAETAALAARTSLGWALLDRAGVVIDTSLSAPDLPRGVRMLPGPHGDRLAIAGRVAESALAAILHGFAIDPAASERAVRISQDPPLHLRIAPWRGARVMGVRKPVAIAMLHGENHLVVDGAVLLVDLFGLLPSEARLAAALARGDRLAEAADALGLTIETARNYSKKIFAKTGAQGQADLVRIIFANGLAERRSASP